METEDLTMDEAMQDILDALASVYKRNIPEGFKSIDEIWAASGKRLSRKQIDSNLNLAVEKGTMEKVQVGRRMYFRAVKSQN